MSPAQSYAYIADFARSIGIPEHLVTSALDAIGAPAQAAHEAQVLHDLTGDLSPQHQAALSESERRQAREEADRYERMMRENPSEYWKSENQQAYREALERSLPSAPEPVPADAGFGAAPSIAPPASPAAAPVPAPTAPAAP
jgi:hypothetical protein